MKKIIEVNLGIGLNQFFPEPVKILVGEEWDEEVDSENTEDTDESNNN